LPRVLPPQRPSGLPCSTRLHSPTMAERHPAEPRLGFLLDEDVEHLYPLSPRGRVKRAKDVGPACKEGSTMNPTRWPHAPYSPQPQASCGRTQ
jgi:hypothetical protein